MSNETSQETWNATHAQLLKSVADAQAKLLAAQNETCDRLEVLSKDYSSLGAIFNQLRDEQASQRLALQAGIMSLSGKLDAIGTVLAELLQAKSYRTRPKSKRHR